tara:strand:+ start:267 stop:515 length:249 start_codon:yes stop_codon:yes gene_type:complete
VFIAPLFNSCGKSLAKNVFIVSECGPIWLEISAKKCFSDDGRAMGSSEECSTSITALSAFGSSIPNEWEIFLAASKKILSEA